jgi:hypothetical protein
MIAHKRTSVYNEVMWTGEKLYRGLSWVNLAPIASRWHGADANIVKNTYEAYLTYGSVIYNFSGKPYRMLDACTDIDENNKVIKYENHVIGKGLAWELAYLYDTKNEERLCEMIDFIESCSSKTYPECYKITGELCDSANQEQASWIIYELARIFGICKTKNEP